MKKIVMMLFSLTVLACMGAWAQTGTQTTSKSSTTAASAKAMNMTGMVSNDGKTFVVDKTNKKWTIDNPNAVKSDEGQHVRLSATENTTADTLHVDSAKMLKSKTTTSNKS